MPYLQGLGRWRSANSDQHEHVAVIACMDARLDVYRILGLQDGEAHVIRNAGGVITDDEIRSLAISQRLLGTKGRSSSSITRTVGC